MKKEMYCYNCDCLRTFEIKKEKSTYKIHNISFDVIEDVYYCSKCMEELVNDDLNNKLKKVYNTYLNFYNLSFEKFKKIRESYHLSQEDFAKTLGWSKKTIVRYENEQSLPLPDYLLTYSKIQNNKMEFLKILNERKIIIGDNDYYKILNKVKIDIDPKTINVLLYLLKDNSLNKTQIMKNLFAVDFLSYQQNDKSITNLSYIHGYFGPMIDNKNNFLLFLVRNGYLEFLSDENDNIIFMPTIDADLHLFSKEELNVLEKVKNKLKGKTAKELTDWAHNFIGWKETKNGEVISFDYAKYLEL